MRQIGLKWKYHVMFDLDPTHFRMRLNFLNHLEAWSEQAKERSASVVVAKVTFLLFMLPPPPPFLLLLSFYILLSEFIF